MLLAGAGTALTAAYEKNTSEASAVLRFSGRNQVILKESAGSSSQSEHKWTPGWNLVQGKWYYCNSEGQSCRGWLQLGRKWYYLNPADGVMQTGWVRVDGHSYFLNDSGVLVFGTIRSGGSFFLEDFFGVSREQFLNHMYSSEAASHYNFYLNTPYVGWGEDHAVFSNGRPRSDGYTGLNCAGFVYCAIRDAGCNLAMVEKHCDRLGVDAQWGLTGASVWWKFMSNESICWRSYTVYDDLLNDAWVQQGDVLYCFPTGGGDSHICFYWGNKAGEDLVWHSIHEGNCIGPMVADEPCIYYVFKWSDPESQGAKSGWSLENGKWYYLKSGIKQTGWKPINGTWYFFKADGSMAASEWIDGYFFSANGAWTYKPRGSWKQNQTGWWYGDTSGWYARNETVMIDGVLYTFDANGYWMPEKTDISSAAVTAKDQTYTGKALKPAVTVKLGKTTLKKDTDYSVEYKNNVNAGKATVTVTGKGNYEGTVKTTFTISKAKNPLTLKKASFAYRKAALKKAKTFNIKIPEKQGKVTYKPDAAARKAGIKITKKGRVTVPENCRAGTFKIRVKAAGNKNFKAGTKTVTIKVSK